MKKIFYLFLIINCCGTNVSISKSISKDINNYTFTYIFENYSLGLIDGRKKIKVLVKDNKISSILNLKTGYFYTSKKNIPGLKEILDRINDIKSYNSFPKIIKSNIKNNMIGNSYIIKVIDYKTITNPVYKIDAYDERIKEYELNYKKWIASKLSYYQLRYKDSRDSKHIEGVEIVVKDNQIISAIDTRTLKKIDVDSKESFITIDKIFKLIKGGISNENDEHLIVDYNERRYGYPSVIILRNRLNDNIYQIYIYEVKRK